MLSWLSKQSTLLVIVLLVACGPSEEELNATTTQIAAIIFATQTAAAPTATSTPIPTLTPKSTASSTPTDSPTSTTPKVTLLTTPDLAALFPTLADLPPGFEKVPYESIALSVPDECAECYAVFLTRRAPFECVSVFIKQLMPTERTRFDQEAGDAEVMAITHLNGMGIAGIEDENVLDYSELLGLDDIGELSSGFTMTLNTEEQVIRMDRVQFRRGDLGIMVVISYPDKEVPLVKADDLARLLDRRIKGEPSEQTTGSSLCIPMPISPADGEVLDNGRTDRNDAIVWEFAWSGCPGASVYHLYVIGATASIPAIDVIVSDTFFQSVSNGGFIIERNRFGWQWRVRAQVDGEWSEWSPTRLFDVEPVDSDS